MADGNFVYLTRERIVEIEKELKEMKINGRKSMAEKIAEARAHGDLSENAEYDAAKEEQGFGELGKFCKTHSHWRGYVGCDFSVNLRFSTLI